MSADTMRAALEFIATHDSSHWPERCRNNVKMARAALAAAPEEPPVETLLAWAVEDGVIRMSQCFDADLQDALSAFARRLLAARPQEPQP